MAFSWRVARLRGCASGDVGNRCGSRIFCDSRCDDGFSQTDDIGEKEAAVFLEFKPPVIHGVSLVTEALARLSADRSPHSGLYSMAGPKYANQELHVEFERCEVVSQVALTNHCSHQLG